MIRKVSSHFFSKTKLDLMKAIRGFESPYLVLENLNVPSISLEVLDLTDKWNLNLTITTSISFIVTSDVRLRLAEFIGRVNKQD